MTARALGLFVKYGVVVVALVLAGMMALSAFSIEVPLSTVTVTTVGDTTVTTKCSWLHLVDSSRGCTTTHSGRSK
jgi:hypothetical protein